MKILRHLRPYLVIAFAVLALCTSNALGGQAEHLELRLLRNQKASVHPLFRVEFHNSGKQPLVLNLGSMIANGKEQFVTAVRLFLTGPHGKSLPLELLVAGAFSGRIDPMIVPLPRGGTFTFPVDLEDYCWPKGGVWELRLVPGHYTLRAEYTGVTLSRRWAALNPDMAAIALMPYWTGTVLSTVVPFTVSRRAGTRTHQNQ